MARKKAKNKAKNKASRSKGKARRSSPPMQAQSESPFPEEGGGWGVRPGRPANPPIDPNQGPQMKPMDPPGGPPPPPPPPPPPWWQPRGFDWADPLRRIIPSVSPGFWRDFYENWPSWEDSQTREGWFPTPPQPPPPPPPPGGGGGGIGGYPGNVGVPPDYYGQTAPPSKPPPEPGFGDGEPIVDEPFEDPQDPGYQDPGFHGPPIPPKPTPSLVPGDSTPISDPNWGPITLPGDPPVVIPFWPTPQNPLFGPLGEPGFWGPTAPPTPPIPQMPPRPAPPPGFGGDPDDIEWDEPSTEPPPTPGFGPGQEAVDEPFTSIDPATPLSAARDWATPTKPKKSAPRATKGKVGKAKGPSKAGVGKARKPDKIRAKSRGGRGGKK